jgi:hypothetical protein
MSTVRGSLVSSLWIAMAVLTGCGSAGAPSGTVTNPPSEPSSALQYAQCMRANGVPNFPDPPIKPGSGIDFRSPAFQSASKACARYLPRSNGSPPEIPAAVRREWLAFAKCVRANGFPSLPDPRSERHPVPSRQSHPSVAGLPARAGRLQAVHRRRVGPAGEARQHPAARVWAGDGRRKGQVTMARDDEDRF